MTRAGLVWLLLAGCAPSVRFADRAVLWWDRDDAPVPQPRSREALLLAPGVEDEIWRSGDQVLDLDFGRQAVNVNALDEVPNSSWFEDVRRDPIDPGKSVRPRALTAHEMEAGGPADGPDLSAPLTVEKGKSVGATPGLIVRDARGVKFLLKFDAPEWPGLATSTEIVAARLTWASGWRVPMMTLIELRPGDLRVAPGATTRDKWGHKQSYTPQMLDEFLQRRVAVGAGGVVRALASRWLDGINLGPFDFYGRRDDDPNDRVPHQDRRDLRGFGILSMWMNNIDTQELNGLDMYVGKASHGHVVHYQQDVGGSFGSRAIGPTDYWMGDENYFATGRILGALVSFGTVPRRWEGDGIKRARAHAVAAWPELGWFDAEHFEPRSWQPMVHNPAFDRQTARDRYWGAKRVALFGADEVRGAIAAGRYRPAAAERLFDVLWRRRDKLLRAFFGDVAALDYFRLEGERLCFDDLWLDAGLGGEAATAYQQSGGVGLDGRCVILGRAPGYHVIALAARRPGQASFGPSVRVHIVADPGGARRIVGVER
jgi:hypothetical protein